MDVKNHFFLTFVALFSLGVMIIKPNTFRMSKSGQRDCRLSKGKVTCLYRPAEYRINHTAEALNYYLQDQ